MKENNESGWSKIVKPRETHASGQVDVVAMGQIGRQRELEKYVSPALARKLAKKYSTISEALQSVSGIVGEKVLTEYTDRRDKVMQRP